MEISKKDRILLINQYTILKYLEPDEADHYDQLIEVLRDGYAVFYSMVDEWVSDDMPVSEGSFVLDLLSLYRVIENYKSNNSDDDEVWKHHWGQFRGFDGNNEGKYMTFARFLVDKQHKFSEQEKYKASTDDFNSHSLTLDKYRSMVAKWKELKTSAAPSREVILAVLNSIECNS